MDQQWGGSRDRKESLSTQTPSTTPRDSFGLIHMRDSSNNSAKGGLERFLRSHVVHAAAALSDEPGRAAG